MVKKLCFVLAARMLLLFGCGGNETAEIDSGNTLSISLNSLTEEPLLVDWEQDGQPMQMIALQDGDDVLVAYNTCQSCASSPYAYYEYASGVLTCQNCGFTFDLDAVGAVAGGCNPKPVGDYAVENGTVVIGASELAAAAPEFATWKKF